jgi:ATP-dependent Zn protease
MIALGGTVAELLILGSRSTGSANDFEQAVDIAKKMVYTGLSDLGIVSREDVPKDKVNEEVNKIIKEQEKKVQKMLEEKLEYLEKIANILRKEETMSGEKLRELIGHSNFCKNYTFSF